MVRQDLASYLSHRASGSVVVGLNSLDRHRVTSLEPCCFRRACFGTAELSDYLVRDRLQAAYGLLEHCCWGQNLPPVGASLVLSHLAFVVD